MASPYGAPTFSVSLGEMQAVAGVWVAVVTCVCSLVMDFGIIDLELPHFNSVRGTVVGQQPSGPVSRVGECIWATQVIVD